ncbi:MAG: flagellar motor switch protein FliN [Acidobacteria bacterium]|nr:MAG: flagellar motor switch protein FliN [Acidobacteriota bacterium]
MNSLNTEQTETLGILAEVIADSSFTVLSMLLGRDIDLMPTRSDVIPQQEVEELNWQKTVIAKATFTKGIEGQIYFVFNMEDVTKIIDLMLGGEGEPAEELNEDSSDALSETINQILGATSQTLTERIELSVSVGQAEVDSSEDPVTLIQNHIASESFPGIDFTMGLDDLINSKMVLAINETMLNSLTEALNRKDETPPAAFEANSPAETPQPAASTVAAPQPTAAPVSTPAPGFTAPPEIKNIDLLMDIELPILIQIGKTELLLQDILKLTPGAIIELNKATEDPIDMLVNDKLVARGEVVVVEGNFAFRITEIASPADRIQSLR